MHVYKKFIVIHTEATVIHIKKNVFIILNTVFNFFLNILLYDLLYTCRVNMNGKVLA
jgi:hypothetical protein